MFGSGVIITGGKRRSDVNATYATYAPDPSPRHVQVVAARESLSGVFRGSLEAYSPGACSQVSGRSDILTLRGVRRSPHVQSHVYRSALSTRLYLASATQKALLGWTLVKSNRIASWDFGLRMPMSYFRPRAVFSVFIKEYFKPTRPFSATCLPYARLPLPLTPMSWMVAPLYSSLMQRKISVAFFLR